MTPPVISVPTTALAKFDELYVISDLHLGGMPGSQIFDSGAALVRLVEHLRTGRPADREVALVINGDFVDFLAERPAAYFDPGGAVQKLNRIADDKPAFAPVFVALKKFVGTKCRSLVVTLGNHDLELALPWVRNHLLGLLSGNNEAARGRITLALDGSGFLCRVGGATVLCLHGNEVDAWNHADHETIRRIGRDVQQGHPVGPWIPNAGTQLVVDVINGIKDRYPFVDLLKPEARAVVPTLLALAPDQRDRVAGITASVRRLAWDAARRATGFLAEQENGTAGTPSASSSGEQWVEPGGDLVTHLSRSGREAYADALLMGTEERLSANVQPLALVARDSHAEYLGVVSSFRSAVRGRGRVEVLREALQDLGGDTSFEPDVEDETYRRLDAQVGGGIDFLLSGHTHLERALPRKRARGYYFNSGTWVRRIRLTRNMLEDRARFARIYEAFGAGTMEALDAEPELVVRRLCVAAIWSDGAGTHGELRYASRTVGGETLPENPEGRFTVR